MVGGLVGIRGRRLADRRPGDRQVDGVHDRPGLRVDDLEAVEERELHVGQRAVRAEDERPHAGVEAQHPRDLQRLRIGEGQLPARGRAARQQLVAQAAVDDRAAVRGELEDVGPVARRKTADEGVGRSIDDLDLVRGQRRDEQSPGVGGQRDVVGADSVDDLIEVGLQFGAAARELRGCRELGGQFAHDRARRIAVVFQKRGIRARAQLLDRS